MLFHEYRQLKQLFKHCFGMSYSPVIMNGMLATDQMACCLCLQCPHTVFQLTSV